MKIGISTFSTDQTIDPAQLAVEVEQRGFAALFLTDHTHIPVARRTPLPGAYAGGGGELPEHYKRINDPFVALATAAASTSTLTVGTGVCLAAQRDPIVTAKQVASIDALSGGRFAFGVGFGWNVEEAEAHGVIWKRRYTIMREKIAVMKALWTEDVASFHGDLVNLEDSWAWPKPVQRPHPRLYLGGGGPTTMRHAIDWADAWFPTVRPDDPTFAETAPRFRALAEESGRDPDSIGIAVASAPGDAKLLEAYRDQGMELVTLRLEPAGADDTLRSLDALAEVLDEVS